MDNPIQMDDFGGETHYFFGNTQIIPATAMAQESAMLLDIVASPSAEHENTPRVGQQLSRQYWKGRPTWWQSAAGVGFYHLTYLKARQQGIPSSCWKCWGEIPQKLFWTKMKTKKKRDMIFRGRDLFWLFSQTRISPVLLSLKDIMSGPEKTRQTPGMQPGYTPEPLDKYPQSLRTVTHKVRKVCPEPPYQSYPRCSM